MDAGNASRHQNRRRAVAAADVGHPRARPQLLDDAVERGQPRVHQVREIAGAEEPLGPLEQVVVVLVPAHALAGPEALGDVGLVLDERRKQLEGARDEDRAVVMGERERLLRREPEGAGLVLDVPAGGLLAEPLAQVALAATRAGRQVPPA